MMIGFYKYILNSFLYFIYTVCAQRVLFFNLQLQLISKS